MRSGSSRKKRILIDATGSSGWIGGVYHKKNILFSMLQNEWIRDNFSILLVTNPEYLEEFIGFADSIDIRTITFEGIRQKKLKMIMLAALHHSDYLYPNIDNRICRWLHMIGINWVPDYQHYHYREFFSDEEFASRESIDRQTYQTSYPLVLSSHACLDDFRSFCSEDFGSVYVVPFVSYIETAVHDISESYLMSVCDKFGIAPGNYIMTANQFWKHKNHKVVLEAIHSIIDRLDEKIRFVFTGQLSDYRDGGYIDSIRDMLSSPDIASRCICTGFIDRKEQLALMKGARFIIQPSLFEGWGTVLEDAKVLDKTVLLSDIAVHREQMNEKCHLFDPLDADALGGLILDTLKLDITDDIPAGIERMYIQAKEYSREFERLLKENR